MQLPAKQFQVGSTPGTDRHGCRIGRASLIRLMFFGITRAESWNWLFEVRVRVAEPGCKPASAMHQIRKSAFQ